MDLFLGIQEADFADLLQVPFKGLIRPDVNFFCDLCHLSR